MINAVLVKWINPLRDITNPSHYVILNYHVELMFVPASGDIDADLELFEKITPFPEPVVDSRIFLTGRIEGLTNEQSPNNPRLRVYKILFSPVKRHNGEIILACRNAENHKNGSIFTNEERDKMLILGLAHVIRRTRGITATAKETALADAILERAVKIWQNDDVLLNKLQQIANNQTPNIDEGWVS